jgi:hypothetical protein
MAEEKLEGNRNLKNAGKILGLFTDETIPDETSPEVMVDCVIK